MLERETARCYAEKQKKKCKEEKSSREEEKPYFSVHILNVILWTMICENVDQHLTCLIVAVAMHVACASIVVYIGAIVWAFIIWNRKYYNCLNDHSGIEAFIGFPALWFPFSDLGIFNGNYFPIKRTLRPLKLIVSRKWFNFWVIIFCLMWPAEATWIHHIGQLLLSVQRHSSTEPVSNIQNFMDFFSLVFLSSRFLKLLFSVVRLRFNVVV